MTRVFTAIAALIFIGFSAISADSQSGSGWVQVFDGKTVGDWNVVGDANWRVEDGALVADKIKTKGTAHLVSKKSYKDFAIYAEFWASDDANSGIFIRCNNSTKISSKNCYEVNIYDQRPEPKYGTGAIVDVAAVNPMPRAGGKWNTFEITAKGPHMTVIMNGQKTVDVKHDAHAEGPLTLQYGRGVIKFRKVAVKPL
ncbi:MAG: DUF1080 domain-containing protein [Rhizobiales bacterium]|nr:DUF1080 domain-containing protein [Hyphomicrobiales bacterium]